MKEFSLAEALRYLTAGFVFFGGLFAFDRDQAVAITSLGEVSLLGLCLGFGALCYPTYRGLIYNRAIPWLQDWVQKARNRHTYRTYLQEWFNCSRREATELFLALRGRVSPMAEAHKAVDATIANVHLGYISALIASGFAVASIATARAEQAAWWVAFAFILFVGTFLFEQRFQADELVRLRLVDTDEVKRCARALGLVESGRPTIPKRKNATGKTN